MDCVAGPVLGDDDDPNPDLWDLFRHYDELYFRGAVAGAGFAVDWSSPTMTGYFGSCTFGKLGNTITLSERVLKYRPATDLKNTLLHLMIHAILYIKHDRNDGKHGPIFRAWMDAINSCTFEDNQRPPGGYNINTNHHFGPEISYSIQGLLWVCELCGDNFVRATRLGPPSHACCIENVDNGTTCGNMLCQWHNHKMNCHGTYAKAGTVSKAPEAPLEKRVLEGRQRLPIYSPEMSNSGRNVQESDSAEFQRNAIVRRPDVDGNLLSLVGGKDAILLGSSSSKKIGKRHRPEGIQKSRSSMTEKVSKHNKPESVQKSGALHVASHKRPMQKGECKTRKSGTKKEFAVISLWMDYYESEGSSGSTEPLVNKRTERRKKNRSLSKLKTYSRSRKRGSSSTKTQPHEGSSS